MASDATSRSTSGRTPAPHVTPPSSSAASAAAAAAAAVALASGTGGVATGSTSQVGTSAFTSEAGRATPTGAPRWHGKRVGRFKLVAEIGKGAMGRVFRAQDEVLDRFVALKIVPSKTRDGSRSRQLDRFVHEARAAAGLEHPNIVTVFDVAEHKDVYAIAMELVEGGDLETLVRANAPLDVPRACLLAAEAAEGLAHAHALGVLHRDIKPSNLMLSRNGRCKVCDFGLAQVLDANDACDLNDVNKSVGTPLYAAPEVIRGQGASPRSDVYSLGATLFFLLTGRPPFLAPGKAAIIQRHLNEPAPDVRELCPEVPVTLADVIARCLSKDPDDRFQDAGALAKVLRVHTIAVESGPSRSAKPTVARARAAGGSPAPSSGRRWALIGGGSLAAVLVVGLGIMAVVGGPDEPAQTLAPAGTPKATAAVVPVEPPTAPVQPQDPPAARPKDAAALAATTVHVTRSGKKYHSAGCRSLENSDIPISLADAKAKGLTACSTCSPPE